MKTKHTSIQNKQIGKSDSDSELQSRSEQLTSEKASGEKLPRLDYDLRRQNRALPTDKVLALLREEAPRFFELAEVVGNWVWIQFGEKQPRTVTAVLSQLGFHWNNKRQAWQHPCGQPMQTPASYDPRERYGSKFPADMRAA